MSGEAVRQRVKTVSELESFYREKISKVRFLDSPTEQASSVNEEFVTPNKKSVPQPEPKTNGND